MLAQNNLKMRQRALFVLIMIPLLSNCNGQVNESDSTDQDSIYLLNFPEEIKVSDEDLIKCYVIADTLTLVSTMTFIYYPFGIFESIEDFSNQMPLMTSITEKYLPYGDPSSTGILLRKYFYKASTIEVWHDDDTENIEIIAAEILDPDILLSKQIEIGMLKGEFIKSFSFAVLTEDIRNVNVVKFVSGLTGIWQTYEFKNDTLSSIKIVTDYQF